MYSDLHINIHQSRHYFAPHRSIWAFDHTNSLIFIHNVAYFAQNKKSTPFHKEVDGNLNLNLIL